MTNTKFQNKVQQWLLERGDAKIGNWSIEVGQKTGTTRILVEMKVNGETMSGKSVTINNEDAIHNAVLALNEQLKLKIDDAAKNSEP